MSKLISKQDLTETIRLSIPIVIAQLGVVLMGVTDNMMVGRMLGVILGTSPRNSRFLNKQHGSLKWLSHSF